MKLPNNTMLIILTIVLLAFPTLGIVTKIYKKAKQPSLFRFLLAPESATSQDFYAGHFIIYLDVNACLSCTEDMAAWVGLEEKLSQCGCSFSLYAPLSDSIDVSYAMALEGLTTPVQVLNQETIDDLGWSNERTPIKALLDNKFEPIDIEYAMGNRTQSRNYIENLISKVCQ